MSDAFLLNKSQMARISPTFPLTRGLLRVDDRCRTGALRVGLDAWRSGALAGIPFALTISERRLPPVELPRRPRGETPMATIPNLKPNPTPHNPCRLIRPIR